MNTTRALVTMLLVAAVAAALLGGVAGGLLRAGALPPPAGLDAAPAAPLHAVLAHAALNHAALMVGAFFGTVIGLERAVALRHRLAFAGPLASAAAGVALLAGQGGAARALLLAASAAFVGASLAIVRRQPAAHTRLLAVAAGAWLLGNLLFAGGGSVLATHAAWFSFLVLTIAAERLEMTRLLRRRPGATRAFAVIVGLLLAGAAASAPWPVAGGLLTGTALALLGGWLLLFDIARRTVHAHGLTRYMAVCLLLGHAWLPVAGLAWGAMALGLPARDIAFHALGLGFVFSMVMGHAPVILPALVRLKVAFGWPFYVPLALLHGSLLLRLGAGAFDGAWLARGALLNAAALALFALTVAGGIAAWPRRRAP